MTGRVIAMQEQKPKSGGRWSLFSAAPFCRLGRQQLQPTRPSAQIEEWVLRIFWCCLLASSLSSVVAAKAMWRLRFALALLWSASLMSVIILPTLAAARSRLPQCPSDTTAYWTICQGTFTGGRGVFTGGRGAGVRYPLKYVGEFTDNKKNGQGIEIFLEEGGATGRYVGEFRNGFWNGQGTMAYANGNKYVGEFRDGKRNGQGIFTWADGRSQKAIWENDEPLTPPYNASFEVPIKISGGTFVVPVTINGEIRLDFTIDSGASDVSIPADVVSTLIRTGSLTASEFLGEEKYILADGSIVPSHTFVIRSLRVGDKVLENVKGSVASAKGSLLLGQSFLSRFNSWSIDNKRQMLVLN